METRFLAELRAQVNGDKLTGYAHVFGQVAKVGRGYERMAPEAFQRSLSSGKEIIATQQHNPALLLGSTRSGTLKVGTDEHGLAFEVPKLPDTSYARDLRELIERGDIGACSFGFMPGEQEYSKAPNGGALRTHTSVGYLFDVSVVALPAYDGTEAHLRSIDFSDEEQEQDIASQLIRIRHKVRSI